MANLELLLERLVTAHVEFVVIGGFAAVVHGASYVTFDVDVCCPLSQPNLGRIHAAVADLHPFHRMTPNEIPFQLTPGFERGLKNIYLKTDLGQLDCLGSLPDVGDYEFVKAHSQTLNLSFGPCQFLDLATLIHAKQTVGRDKDLLVVKELRAIAEAAKLKTGK